MRQTKKLLQELNCRCIRGELPREVKQVAYDSRNVEPGGLFVCIRGSRQDGHAFIREAVERGAVVILTEKGAWKEDNSSQEAAKQQKYCVLETPDTRAALASIARQWFDNPQEKLKIVGVTGTKGKTSTAWMIWKMFTADGKKCGLIGTIEVCYGIWQQTIRNTTPESYELYEILRKMVDQGCQYVVMEVSSQALKMHRVDGIMFDAAVFTNLREDHIGAGEHADFAEYMACKQRLFCQCRTGIFNQDDPYWQEMWRGSSCERVFTYGFSRQADYCADRVQLLRGSDRLGVQYHLTRHRTGKKLECGGKCSGQVFCIQFAGCHCCGGTVSDLGGVDGKSIAHPAGAGTHRNASGITSFYCYCGLCAQCHGTGCIAADAAGLSSGTNHLHFRLRWQPGGRTQIPDGRGGRSAGRSGGGDHG